MNYSYLAFDVGILPLHATTIFCTFLVIMNKKSAKLDRISSSFLIFLVSRGFGALLDTSYHLYLIVYWLKEGHVNYEPYAHLWFGMGMVIHWSLSSVSAFLLTLERCTALAFPLLYNSRLANWFPRFTLICFVFWIILAAFSILREIPLDVEKLRSCQLYSCLLAKHHISTLQYAKLGVGGLNVLASCYLIYAMKQNNGDKLKNSVVKFTIAMEIFLDVIPSSVNYTFVTVTGISLGVYVAKLIPFLQFLNVTVCSVYYSWRLSRKTSWFWRKVQRVSPANLATQ
ncbi:hypothetical protein DdX_20085 [Ditylenchus destructor]|uniref:7TM GPCR serpentine receptor class x (Srx) domain-containing protein n=1 Tax=Ditylenchus destructor TaxID=166010 RepID=A0AAD4MGS4_9BILA|nr:hypothetical protein DdX_20085 [Ditylenchus destructor]